MSHNLIPTWWNSSSAMNVKSQLTERRSIIVGEPLLGTRGYANETRIAS
ncbi:hypothetical protein [Chamaesiphon minutus]|nr:hypothetical protein [Chamaesiphon minutus]